MGNIAIKYTFRFPDNTEEVIELELDPHRLELVENVAEDLPPWTCLDFHQCPNCPLSLESHPYCPLMANLAGILRKFEHILSYDQVYLDVITQERRVSQQTTAQRALSSLMGLVIATGGCPHTVFFRPMARFHLPLASEEETLYRATSMYLLAQYFLRKEGGEVDWDFRGLDDIYKNVQLINSAIAVRLRDSNSADSSVNAVILLDMYAKAMPYVIEESLEELRYLFSSYVDNV